MGNFSSISITITDYAAVPLGAELSITLHNRITNTTTVITEVLAETSGPGTFVRGTSNDGMASNIRAAFNRDYDNLPLRINSVGGLDVAFIMAIEQGWDYFHGWGTPIAGLSYVEVDELLDIPQLAFASIDPVAEASADKNNKVRIDFTIPNFETVGAPLLLYWADDVASADFPLYGNTLKNIFDTDNWFVEVERYSPSANRQFYLGKFQMVSEIASPPLIVSDALTVPSVAKWQIDSITRNEAGTEAAIAVSQLAYGVTPDYTLEMLGLQWSLNNTDYFGIALPITNIDPETTYTVYVRDVYGGVKTHTLYSSAGEVYPSIVFADKNQRTDIAVSIVDPVSTNMLRALLRITFPTSGKSITKSLPVTNNQATFNINNVLWGQLVDAIDGTPSQFFAFPANPNALAVNRTATHMLPFIVDYGYSYVNAALETVEIITTDNANNPNYGGHFAIFGGVSRTLQSYLQGINTTPVNWFADAVPVKFLTNMPAHMPIHPRQPQRLWIINNGKWTAATLRAQVAYTDGTLSTVVTRANMTGDTALWELAVGPLELNLQSIDITKQIVSYQVWVSNADGDAVSEVRFFTIDNTYYYRNDVYFFRNSLGVHETVWMHGLKAESDSFGRTEQLRPTQPASIYRGTIVSERASVTSTVKANSGFTPKRLRHWLGEFMASRDILLPVGLFMLPVIITDDSMDKGDDAEDLYAFGFTCKLAHTESHYSAIPDVASPWGDFNNDFNNDFLI